VTLCSSTPRALWQIRTLLRGAPVLSLGPPPQRGSVRHLQHSPTRRSDPDQAPFRCPLLAERRDNFRSSRLNSQQLHKLPLLIHQAILALSVPSTRRRRARGYSRQCHHPPAIVQLDRNGDSLPRRPITPSAQFDMNRRNRHSNNAALPTPPACSDLTAESDPEYTISFSSFLFFWGTADASPFRVAVVPTQSPNDLVRNSL
jgi:hypothetical protein